MFWVKSLIKSVSSSFLRMLRDLAGLATALRYCENVSLKLKISPRAELEKGVYSLGDVRIGKNVKIGKGTYINSGIINNVEIGRYCSIAYNVLIGMSEHDPSAESTSPVYALEKYGSARAANKEVRTSVINDHVWIGAGVIILQGVEIGEHSIVAAGAVVTKNVPPREIWGGVPAKKIRDR